MKTNLVIIAICAIFTALPMVGMAQTYQMMAPLPIISDGGQVTIATFLPGIYKLAVGIASTASVVIIILAGFKYMTSEGGKSEAKQSIQNALIGLLMLLGSYLLLNTINPELLKLRPDFGKGGPGAIDFEAIARSNANFSGFTPELIADIEKARVEFNQLMSEGRVEEANELFFNSVTDVNFRKALNLAGGDPQERQLAAQSIATMNSTIDQQIAELARFERFDEIPALEAKQRFNNDTFNQTSKEVILTQSLKTGATNVRAARQEITIMQSEAEQTFAILSQKDPSTADTFKQQSDARIRRLTNLLSTGI